MLRRLTRRQLLVLGILVGIGLWFLFNVEHSPYGLGDDHLKPPFSDRDHSTLNDQHPLHPIDALILDAYNHHQAVVGRITANVEEGAEAYRKRRGRHPPPGFGRWYSRALAHNVVIVEEFFDQVYEDLEPFWGVQPTAIRNAVADWDYVLSVRNGEVLHVPQDRAKSRVWGDMLRQISRDLPDLDIAINPLDEPRVVAPWELVNAAYKEASVQKARMVSLPISSMMERSPIFRPTKEDNQKLPNWVTEGNMWELVIAGCETEPLLGNTQQEQHHFVRNWTGSKDICVIPHLARCHGALIEPASLSVVTSLIPIFSAAKLSTNNDILLPPPSYYEETSMFTATSWLGGSSTRHPWASKISGLVWRGKATGGTTRPSTWQKFHRHRFVSMLNASGVGLHAEFGDVGPPFDLQDQDPSALSRWLEKTSDVAFTDLFCRDQEEQDPVCPLLSAHYSLAPELSMQAQYKWKYLPDIDGNSLSGRFRAFMRSNSAPMKATIFKEWHDSRLIPWAHFVPLNITFRDLWAVMAYFLGFGSLPDHDEEGRFIAEYGKEWAERVLRKEDMEIYMLRVLLEYARLCDDERDRLGYVADLI